MKRKISLVLLAIALVLSFPAALLAAVSFNANTTLTLPSGVSLIVANAGSVDSISITGGSNINIDASTGQTIEFRSNDKYDFNVAGSSAGVVVTETCSDSYNSLTINAVSGSISRTISVDSATTCTASSSNSSNNTGSSGSSGSGSSVVVPPAVTPAPAPSVTTIAAGASAPVGSLGVSGTNVMMNLNSQATFNSAVTSGGFESHDATVTQIDTTTKQITIAFHSNPSSLSLGLGQSASVDLNGDGQNDIKVMYSGLTGSTVNLTFSLLPGVFQDGGKLVALACAKGASVNDPCKAVYYVGNNGKRYVFPNEKTYKTWYQDFSGVQVVSADKLASFPIGGNVTYRPGVKLVKINTDPKVYAVSAKGTLRWLQTADVAQTLYGANWAALVDDVADSFFVNYMTGSDISAAAGYSVESSKTNSPDINTDKGL